MPTERLFNVGMVALGFDVNEYFERKFCFYLTEGELDMGFYIKKKGLGGLRGRFFLEGQFYYKGTISQIALKVQ